MEQDAFANVVLAWCLDESGGLLTFTRVCYARNNERVDVVVSCKRSLGRYSCWSSQTREQRPIDPAGESGPCRLGHKVNSTPCNF